MRSIFVGIIIRSRGQCRGGPMAYTTHSRDFRPMRRSHSAIRKRHRAGRAGRLTDALAAPRQSAVDREIARVLAARRTHHGQHGARNHAEASGVRLEPAVAVSCSLKRNLSSQGFTLMAPAPLYDRFVEPAPRAHANESAPDPDHLEFRMLRAERLPDIRLALRPARSSDGDALQTYVRGLFPQSRDNRFLGAANELPASELARALAANGRDTLTLLLTSTVEDRETVVGETRMALSCAERAGEFSMSIADDWQHVASARRCSRKSNARRRPTASN